MLQKKKGVRGLQFLKTSSSMTGGLHGHPKRREKSKVEGCWAGGNMAGYQIWVRQQNARSMMIFGSFEQSV